MTTVPNVPSESPSGDADWKRRVAQAINAISARVTDVGTTAQRPAKPVNGQMRWNPTTKKPEWWDAASSVWRDAAGLSL
jgi:hypothetical protein